MAIQEDPVQSFPLHYNFGNFIGTISRNTFGDWLILTATNFQIRVFFNLKYIILILFNKQIYQNIAKDIP